MTFSSIIWSQNQFYIELVNERNYPLYINEKGDYNVKARSTQLVFKLNGITHSSKVERIDWKTVNAFSWNDGVKTTNYPIVKSSTYTKNGLSSSLIALPPEMKGSQATIYGFYQNQIDSIRIFIQ